MRKNNGLDLDTLISLPCRVVELLMAKVKWLGNKIIVEETTNAKRKPW